MSALGKKLRLVENGCISFWCPGCAAAHRISVDAGWTWDGNVELPTFSPSIRVTYDGADAGSKDAPPASCHSLVRAGQIEFLNDSTHALAGQTVELPDWPA